ncbi:hypothetical protein Ancab_009852, partial [Ancistrocladus abbreviatus]
AIGVESKFGCVTPSASFEEHIKNYGAIRGMRNYKEVLVNPNLAICTHYKAIRAQAHKEDLKWLHGCYMGETTRAGNKAQDDINSEGSCSSAVPCICTNTKSRIRFALSEYLSGNGKIAVSKSLVFNDDGHSNPSGYNRVVFWESWVAADLDVGYVSSFGKQAMGALMEDKTALIKRREDLETIGSKLALKKPLQAKLDLLDHHLKARRGPILNGLHWTWTK